MQEAEEFQRFFWDSSDNGHVMENVILQSNHIHDRNSSSKCTSLLNNVCVDSTRVTTSVKLRYVRIVADCWRRQGNKTRAISRFHANV